MIRSDHSADSDDDDAEEAFETDEQYLFTDAVALTIAGSDPSGGAGVQADLKTFQQVGAYGMSVVTLLTVQNTRQVTRIETLAPELIAAQFDAVMEDIPPRAIKTGALGNGEIIRLIASKLSEVDCPVVVDPVLISKHGHPLASDDAIEAFKEHLLPQAFLLTPNRYEAELLTGVTLDSMERADEAAYRLEQMGAQHVLIKCGNQDGAAQHLLSLEENNAALGLPFLDADNTHGTGCILSAAITAKLAAGETDLEDAVLFGIRCAYQAISFNSELGTGIHPAEIRAITERL